MKYVVKEGDNLSKIARDILGDIRRWPELQELNHLPNPDLIYPGQILEIPDNNAQNPSTNIETNGKKSRTLKSLLILLGLTFAGYQIYKNRKKFGLGSIQGQTEKEKLYLYTVGDEQLYINSIAPLINELRKKARKKSFNRETAIYQFKKIVSDAAEKYNTEISPRVDFSLQDRKQVAKNLLKHYSGKIFSKNAG